MDRWQGRQQFKMRMQDQQSIRKVFKSELPYAQKEIKHFNSLDITNTKKKL